ncbi:CocE/NonD family hydrolase [Rhizobium leguminosarum]|uniref:CocE/NonD family hydrolase n=1 Tax=Rhizobium leguminosarum TaxID=384 RepID=UPI0013D98901|nr:CocE/NonD family hydrolase [Rhizobium leguminosarum]MBY5312774.1 CocE/NonD family hydrolase [Rhizobium leguminosarum]NEH48979.1 CocE/NonD family hydrolase [Rhizobium leguminosarum]
MLALRDIETLRMRMADGVHLAADVYRPVGPERYPVLVMRLPYGRKVASTVVLAHPAWYAGQGYVVLVQDVRGRGDSEGIFRILEDDVADGAQTLSLAADLPGGNGLVASYGFSYHGMNQFLALAGARKSGAKVPDAMAIAMAAFDVRNHWAFEGDGFRLQSNQMWACQMAVENSRLAGDLDAAHMLHAALPSLHSGAVSARPDVLEQASRYTHYHDWLADDPSYWRTRSPQSLLEGVTLDVPVLHVGGWNDIMLEGTFAAFEAFSAGGNLQRLSIGPWSHIPWGRRVGALDAGADAADGIDREIVAFFDEALKGRENPYPKVRLYDVVKRAWAGFESLATAETLVLHLSSGGRAAATSIDGTLAEKPELASADYLVHDPWRPAPSVGLHLGTPPDFADRAAIDDRADVLVYTSDPLDRPLLLTGAPKVDLFVTADRPSFDLDCTLSMLTSDGAAISVTSGHKTVKAEGGGSPVSVALRPVHVTVRAGHCLRLSIQAASFPAFPVNPGTGAPPQDAAVTDRLVTTLVLRSGDGYPSTLRLPVMRQADAKDSQSHALEENGHEP